MFVGETGVLRVVQRACELAKQAPGGDVRALGGIDLPTIQKYLNLWYSLSLDLFGGEVSSNAATFFAEGLKGRAKEASYEDHLAIDKFYSMEAFRDGRVVKEDVPLRNAMNEVLRDEYVEDAARGVVKWNRAIEAAGIDFRLELPSRRFHRHIGLFSDVCTDPSGKPISKDEFERRRSEWLPTAQDRAYLKSIMARPVYEPGKMANWIAPPAHGIKGRPVEFEYVRHSEA